MSFFLRAGGARFIVALGTGGIARKRAIHASVAALGSALDSVIMAAQMDDSRADAQGYNNSSRHHHEGPEPTTLDIVTHAHMAPQIHNYDPLRPTTTHFGP